VADPVEDQVVTLAIGGELMGGCPAHMVMTNFPRARPECRSRMASGTPLSGYALSMTEDTLPAVSFDPMGRIARRTLYKRLPYKVWECCRLETQS
jgi:hypothetical protein